MTDLYSKPTDTNQYVDRRSCPPNYFKRAIPYSQTLRSRRICSNLEDFKTRLRQIRLNFWTFRFPGLNILLDKRRLNAKSWLLITDESDP